jgi:DNA polymerase-1
MMNEEEEQLSMKRQFIWLNDMLDYLPLKTMIYDGMEADDVIAYIAQDLVQEDEEALIVSTDKDFLQLVSDTVTVFSPTKKKLYDRKAVYEEWGLYPQNLLLFRTLDGDKSDNIPGVKGCGIKTFLKRFPEFEEDRYISFDELFEICEERKGTYKIYDTILENKEIILRNKDLMSLSELTITGSEKLKILDRFNEDDKKFDKMDFLRVGTKYKMLQNWRNINDWLMSTFNNIITK